MSSFNSYIIYRDNYIYSISHTINVGQSIAIEIVRNPSRERERRDAEIRAEREAKLAELESVFQNNQIVALKKAVQVLQGHGKRLTQDGLESKSGGKSRGYDSNAFKKIGKAAVESKILTNATDKRGKGYGIPEWEY